MLPTVGSAFRSFDTGRDLDDVVRIWHESRWIDRDDERQRAALAAFVDGGVAEVGVVDGAAECLVHRTAGTMHHDRTPLPATAVTAVTTSHVGRRRGLASTLTTRALRAAADEGATVATLGMFEQGFYDRFGFGTGSPVLVASFDPASLRLPHVPHRPPVRFGPDDSPALADALRRRLPHHGMVTLDAPRSVEAELGFSEHPFALGYREGGRVTHFLAGSLDDEHGPFRVTMVAYETGAQLLELLRLLHELGDQIYTVTMTEPAHVQLGQLIETPARQRARSRRSDHETVTRAVAWWQLRVLDLAAVVAAHTWPGDPVEFVAEVSDPVADRLDDGGAGGWRGVAGRYRIRLGADSTAERLDGSSGSAGTLPVLRCSAGAVSRLVFGVRPATSLALTDDLVAPPDLLADLDRALCLPVPLPGLEY